jgi:glycosyltransferase involved in cell wall biosynthesis
VNRCHDSLRVLVAHVRYRQPGGEDAVFEAEARLLRQAGHQVSVLDLGHTQFDRLGPVTRAAITAHYADHRYGRRLVAEAIDRFRPDVVHFHNLYPLLGPGAIAEADRLGCATLQTLHNYRLSCLNGRYVRSAEICESCRPAHFGAGARSGCYRGSRALSLLVGRATTRQWQNFVSRGTPLYWLALSPFVRQFYVGLGAPAERIVVKANSVDAGEPVDREGRSGVFCGGRLSPEKGIVPLMRAWPDDAPMLTVAGDGPIEDEVRVAVKHNVRFLGRLEQQSMRAALRKALVVAMPSVWPEPLPLVALEAFAEGTPVVAFAGWSLGSVVGELSSQCVVTYRDFPGLSQRAVELSAAANWQNLSERCVDLWRSMYSHPVNREALLSIYAAALALKRSSTRL